MAMTCHRRRERLAENLPQGAVFPRVRGFVIGAADRAAQWDWSPGVYVAAAAGARWVAKRLGDYRNGVLDAALVAECLPRDGGAVAHPGVCGHCVDGVCEPIDGELASGDRWRAGADRGDALAPERLVAAERNRKVGHARAQAGVGGASTAVVDDSERAREQQVVWGLADDQDTVKARASPQVDRARTQDRAVACPLDRAEHDVGVECPRFDGRLRAGSVGAWLEDVRHGESSGSAAVSAGVQA